MGPIALVLIVLVLPIMAGVLLAAFAGIAYAVKGLAALPVVAWAPSVVAVITGYAGGRWIGRRRQRDGGLEIL